MRSKKSEIKWNSKLSLHYLSLSDFSRSSFSLSPFLSQFDSRTTCHKLQQRVRARASRNLLHIARFSCILALSDSSAVNARIAVLRVGCAIVDALLARLRNSRVLTVPQPGTTQRLMNAATTNQTNASAKSAALAYACIGYHKTNPRWKASNTDLPKRCSVIIPSSGN